MAKLTWNDVYKDFRKRHPTMAKRVLGYEPHSYATILLIFPDRERMTYNYDTREMKRIPRNP